MPPGNQQPPSSPGAPASLTADSAYQLGMQQGLDVQAQSVGASGQFGSFAFSPDGSAIRVPMLYTDPLMDTILILFPQDNIRELNRRLRHYFKYQPFVRNAIEFHVETMLSDWDLDCGTDHREAQDYYNDFKQRKNLLEVATDVTRDHWLLGEGFSYGNWDDFDDEFDEFVQIPPEEIEVHSAYITNRRAYVLRPNSELGKLMSSSNPADRALAGYIKKVNPEQAEKILNNKPYQLKTNRLIVMQRKMAAYSNRGVSPVLSVVKDLLFEDNLNMYRTVFIQRHSYPMKMFKIGDKEAGWIPPASMFLEFRRQLLNSVSDPDFSLITHPFVNVEYVTGQDKVMPLIPWYELVKSRVFAGLFINDAMIGGAKGPYSDGMTFMRGIMHRYLTTRNNLEAEMTRKIFGTLARMKGFSVPSPADVKHRVKTKKRERRPILPKFFWQKANLLASPQMIQMILSLRERGDTPLKYVADLLGWNFDQMISQLKKEESTYADKSWRTLKDKYVADRKLMQRDILGGEKLEEVIKKEYKDEITGDKPKPEKKGAKKGKEFTLPAIAAPTPPSAAAEVAEGEEPAPPPTPGAAGEAGGETPGEAP